MKAPCKVVATLWTDDRKVLVTGDVVRLDKGRVVGSEDEVITLEIRGTFHRETKRRKKK